MQKVISQLGSVTFWSSVTLRSLENYAWRGLGSCETVGGGVTFRSETDLHDYGLGVVTGDVVGGGPAVEGVKVVLEV